MKNLSIIKDNINLKYLLEGIAEHVPNSEISDCKSLIKIILSHMYPDSDIGSRLSQIQKYLSSDTPTTINSIEDINTGSWDDALLSAIIDICNKAPNEGILPRLIHNMVESSNKIHFTPGEYAEILEAWGSHNNPQILFLLFKHAFSNYQHNMPSLLAKRLYDQALTLPFGNEMRYILFKEAADLGYFIANLHYAEYVMSTGDTKTAVQYYIKIIQHPPALWHIASMIESGIISDKQFETISKLPHIKKKVLPCYEAAKAEMSFEVGKSVSNPAHTELAFAMYYFLTTDKCPFPKALASIASMLNKGMMTVNADTVRNSMQHMRDYTLECIEKAARLGSPEAMYMLAEYREKQGYEPKDIEPLLEAAASLGDAKANIRLADIYFERSDLTSARRFIEFAHRQNNASATHRLGVVCEASGDYAGALDHYTQAHRRGNVDSAYNIVLIQVEKLPNPSIIGAIEFLTHCIPGMSPEIAEKSRKYIAYLETVK